MHNKPATLVILSVFLFAFIYILLVNIAAFELSPDSLDSFGKYTQIPLAVIPLIGAFFGLQSSSKWGFTKSLVGKATLFLSLSMLAWGGGMICWLAYIFILGIDNVPYPSMCDFVFIFIQPAHSKLASYIFPVFPAIAILIGQYLSSLIDKSEDKKEQFLFYFSSIVLS